VSWRDRIDRNLLTGVAAAVAWIAVNTVVGDLGIGDWIVAAGFVIGGVVRWRASRPKDVDHDATRLYGPPE
jgi:hypothetical protein